MTQSLRYVDVSRNGFVYTSGNDTSEPVGQTVDMADMLYPNFLRAWREAARLTQDELAEKIGVSKASIGHWETGERKLTLKWLPQLAEALGTQKGWIIEHHPDDVPADVMELWSKIPEADKPKALEVLKAFGKAG